MKTVLLVLLAALALLLNGCSTVGGSADSGPVISGYISTGASTHFNP